MRRPGLWLRARDRCWMTTLDGTQHKLSPDKNEAYRLFYALMGGSPAAPAGRPALSTRKLLDTYLVRTRDRVSEARHAVRVGHLAAVAAAFGHRDPLTLKPHEVNGWLDAPAPAGKADAWGPSMRALCVTVVKAAFAWAAAEGFLPADPLAKLRRRPVARRDRVLTDGERRRLLAEVSPAFRDYLWVLDQTGCRPSEAAGLTAAMIDWGRGAAVLKEHKNARKGKPRAIHFPPPVLARLRELAAEHPDGPLLRNRLGNRWTRPNAGDYFLRACRELGIAGATLYSFRGTWVTNALARGVPVEVVAALAGNSPAVIHKHYDSVNKLHRVLAEAAAKAVS